MSKVIWKFPVAAKIDMPANAKVLAIQPQRGVAMLWALVDPGNVTEPRHFRAEPTGSPISSDSESGTYVGTWQDPPFVWHLFEITAP